MLDKTPRKRLAATPANAQSFGRLAVLALPELANLVADLKAQGVWDGWEGSRLSIEQPTYDALLAAHGKAKVGQQGPNNTTPTP